MLSNQAETSYSAGSNSCYLLIRNILTKYLSFLYVCLSKLSNHADISNSGRKWSFFCHSTRKWWIGDAYQKWLLFLLWIQYNSPEILKVFFDQILHQWLIFMNFFANFGKHIPPLQQRICLWSAGVDIKRAAADNRHISLFECKCSKTWPDKK